MRYFIAILLALVLALVLALGLPASGTAAPQPSKQVGDEDVIDDAFQEELEADEEEDIEEEGDEGDEEYFEDEEELPPEEEEPEEDVEEEAPARPTLPRLPFMRREAPAEKPPVFVGEGEEEPGDEARKVIIDALVNLNYVFNNSPDSFIVTYHFRIEGDIKAKTSVMRGQATVDVKTEGFLAKGPTFECKLKVTVPKAPYQLTFRWKDDENANLDLNFTKPIMETWESNCTFGDSGAKPFVTKGDPEKWLKRALTKTSPPLRRLTAKLSEDEKTTTNFIVNTHQVNDPPLGTIEVDGKGIITIIHGEALREGETE
jgi:hypothetical protein